jgi:hypothetical protein
VTPDAAGIIVDASALIRIDSPFVTALLRVLRSAERSVVIPAPSMAIALASRRLRLADVDRREHTIVPMTGYVALEVARVMAAAQKPVDLEVAHVAYEADVLGFEVLTGRGDAYTGVSFMVNLIEVP